MMTEQEALKEAYKLHQEGRVDEAEKLYVELCTLSPRNADAHNRLAGLYLQTGKFFQAVIFLQKAAELDPSRASFQANLGMAYSRLGEKEKAAACYDKSVSLNPNDPTTLNVAGSYHFESKNYDKAEELYKRAMELDPKAPQPPYNIGLLHFDRRKLEEASAWFDKALALDPNYYSALVNKANALSIRNRFDEAVTYLRRAVVLKNDSWEAATNLTNSLAALGKFDEALLFCLKAIKLQPGNPVMWLNYGNTLKAAGKVHDAIEAYKKCVELDPSNADAHMYLGMACLAAGDFRSGWREYEWRIRTNDLKHLLMPGKKLWDGSRMEDGVILALCEQGFGDTIQFSRYIPMMKELSGAKIKFMCAPSLMRLLKDCGADEFYHRDKPETAGDFDCYYPVMSLPGLFGTTPETVPPAPYLKAEESDIKFWEPRVSALKGKKIGLSWSGNPDNTNDRLRSMKFEHLKPLFELKDVSFVSLQKMGAPPKEETACFSNFHDWSEDFSDFSVTAGLITHLDLVISVDTAIAHLSGALGQRTWVLIPFSPEWRWMHDVETTPWYPAARIVRQRSFDKWSGVVRQLGRELKTL
jgi:tetratricopeptide (TPR) repeat protein